jgi:hypothetical protein
MARSESPDGPLTEDELESFEDALGGLEERVTEFLADGTDRTPEQIDAAIDEYDMPDPLKDRPADEVDE